MNNEKTKNEKKKVCMNDLQHQRSRSSAIQSHQRPKVKLTFVLPYLNIYVPWCTNLALSRILAWYDSRWLLMLLLLVVVVLVVVGGGCWLLLVVGGCRWWLVVVGGVQYGGDMVVCIVW